jgi:hypothetical protein
VINGDSDSHRSAGNGVKDPLKVFLLIRPSLFSCTHFKSTDNFALYIVYNEAMTTSPHVYGYLMYVFIEIYNTEKQNKALGFFYFYFFRVLKPKVQINYMILI